ncbi:hypothetical protein TNCV_2362681 [Trichonephila clavipes]|nr:hypothetical protein TNCV_2362681 [Trichonephila clavipes]
MQRYLSNHHEGTHEFSLWLRCSLPNSPRRTEEQAPIDTKIGHNCPKSSRWPDMEVGELEWVSIGCRPHDYGSKLREEKEGPK